LIERARINAHVAKPTAIHNDLGHMLNERYLNRLARRVNY